MRRDTASPSTKRYEARITPREDLDIRWLAKHRECKVSDLIRLLLTEELDRLVAAGVKVPRR